MLRQIRRHFEATALPGGERQLDPEVARALERVPRHRFVPAALAEQAYEDRALPIGHDQTISQPFIVALMTQLLRLTPDSVVLEVGTGSGYQAAVLDELARAVHSIELVPELAAQAAERLAGLGHAGIQIRCGDGFDGWKERAPFDAILVAAAAPEIPAPLLEQLAPGGRLVMPVGRARETQELVLVAKGSDGRTETLQQLAVSFVPLERA